ncbi:hypothetical protein BDW02DRAFT_230260 [Decorospora gaudefroyi]|uniref:Uncharacterized protein n=1 Tax=Decorospora gaudefroyi TaxID=184978 RepID=A0A6A5KUZ5_9PLEO|nr:hypothetical protein BDW02DRAFT_230260 [Decorospora gaudefroyi]
MNFYFFDLFFWPGGGAFLLHLSFSSSLRPATRGVLVVSTCTILFLFVVAVRRRKPVEAVFSAAKLCAYDLFIVVSALLIFTIFFSPLQNSLEHLQPHRQPRLARTLTASTSKSACTPTFTQSARRPSPTTGLRRQQAC